MGIYSIKPTFQKFLNPIKNLFIKWKVHPTTINIFALIISLTGGLALYFSNTYPLLLLYIPLMAFVRTALNALDGLVARELKIKNQKFGEVLNELSDRLSDVVIFLGIAFSSFVNVYLALTVIILILISSYIAILSKAAGGKRRYEGIMGKADRMFWLSLASIIVYLTKNFKIINYFLIFLAITLIITIIQRFYITKNELYRI